MQAFIRDILFATVLSVFASILFLTQGCGQRIQAVEDYAAIENAFSEFRDAVESQNGVLAVAHVSEGSIERFEEYRKLALSADEAELRERTVTEQIEVLRLRCFMTPQELQTFSGRDVIARLVELDILPTPLIKDVTLGPPVFQPGKCYVVAYDGAGPAKEKLVFLNEGEDWKIDIAAMEYVLDRVYAGMKRKQQGDAKKQLTPAELNDDVIQRTVRKWREDISMTGIWVPVGALGQSEDITGQSDTGQGDTEHAQTLETGLQESL